MPTFVFRATLPFEITREFTAELLGDFRILAMACDCFIEIPGTLEDLVGSGSSVCGRDFGKENRSCFCGWRNDRGKALSSMPCAAQFLSNCGSVPNEC